MADHQRAQAAIHAVAHAVHERVALLGADLAPDLAERLRERSVRVLRSVPGDQRAAADDADEVEREDDAGRELDRRRQRESQRAQAFFESPRTDQARRFLAGEWLDQS